MSFILLINIDLMLKIFNIKCLQETCFERFENAFKRENSLGLLAAALIFVYNSLSINWD